MSDMFAGAEGAPAQARLPISGPLPRPSSVEAAAAALGAEAIDCHCGVVTFETEEFTAVCPRTGQPDYCAISITYHPRGKGLESKSLKLYLWAFREHGAFCEGLAVQMCSDIAEAIDPAHLRVEVKQRPRGGIALTAVQTYAPPRA